MNRRRQAKRLLIGYVCKTMEAAGCSFLPSDHTELGELVDLLFDEIADQAVVQQRIGTVGPGASVTGAKIDVLGGGRRGG